MSVNNFKITDGEKASYGVVNSLDILEGNANENKLRFDRLPNFIADKHNELTEHIANNVFTKLEVQEAINQSVFDAGAADMQKAVYDKDNDGKIDVAKTAETANNANSLQNYKLVYSGKVNGVPFIKSDGVLDIGQYLDFRAVENGQNGRVLFSGNNLFSFSHPIISSNEASSHLSLRNGDVLDASGAYRIASAYFRDIIE